MKMVPMMPTVGDYYEYAGDDGDDDNTDDGDSENGDDGDGGGND